MNRDPEMWARLGQALKQARLARGLSQAELADAAGASTASVQSAEAGVVPKARMPITYARIATALGWPPGSVEAVLNGEAPPGWSDVSVQQQIDADVLEGVITNAMVRATDNATAAEIRAATKIALDELRRRGLIPETDGVQP
ncbi:helix-turn-helix transcriptional regulator [Streptomyces lavendulocolor]|uniref:Helix-turn-helix transcriptional regulator n=1 Tax=Streptomyces lavendulocolor TaxID=67316 RepID=A0ABV2VYC9_9ACTN